MTSRRRVLVGAGLLLPGMPLLAATSKKKEEVEVSANEDLMREHGVLNRALLVYEAWLARDGAPAQVLNGTADLIRRFVEGYHEKIEEQHVFPRLEKAGKLGDLTRILRTQHEAGRQLTARILTAGGDRAKAEAPIRAFIRMYRPHEAREDTILFPAFHQAVGEKEYDRLGDEFEEIEHKTFGQDGFEMAVRQVTQLETELGIADLSQFTPR
jgi:hemerythrin-like domain-containing protein